VQCPQCQTAIGVREDAGGTRVTCPHCAEAFVVPGYPGGNAGSSSSSDDDDDWLNITDTPAMQPIKPRPTASQPVTPDPFFDEEGFGDGGDSSGDGASGDDIFGEKASGSVEFGEDPFGTPPTPEHEDLAAAFDERSAGTNSDGGKIEYQTDYRLRCPTCGTLNDVKSTQAGKQIRCRDCFTMVRVPKPPRVQRKVQIDMEAAPAFQFSSSTGTAVNRPEDPFRKSASELLEAAARTDKVEPKPDLDVPRIRDWAAAVFGIFTQIGVMVHWLILSTLASVIAFFALAIDAQILIVGLFAAGGFFAAIVLACGFTIMQSVANEEDSVKEWPVTLEPMEWLSATVFCFAAAGLAYAPGWFIGYMTFGTSLTTVCLSMMSVFVIFPFVLLSMLDMQNIFVPFSPDVGRSVTRCEEAWGGFYFSSGILFFFTFLVFAFASLFPAPTAAVIGIFIAVGAAFLYFAMIGRLAYAIGQSVNAEARVNNIAEEREQERERKKSM